MKIQRFAILPCAMLSLIAGPAALAAGDQVVIGDIDDLSGVYADVNGQGGIEAVNMAIADFGGTVLGKKIVLLTVDHQNKPDIGASKFREWADQNGLNMLLGGSNTCEHRHVQGRGGKKSALYRHRRRRRLADRRGLHGLYGALCL
jgi:branched-chain amino acid transport system substrate-binding protein